MKRIFLLLTVAVALLIAFNGCSKGNDNDNNNNGSGLFDGSFDNVTTYPEPEAMTWITREGEEKTAKVFPGQIIIIARNASVTQVTALITENGGTVGLQIPKAGYFMAIIDPVKTTDFLAAMYENTFIRVAIPNAPSSARGIMAANANLSGGDANSLIQTVDVQVPLGCGNLSHGQAVANIAGGNGMSVHINDVTVDPVSKESDFDAPFRETMRLIEYANQNNSPLVVNVSLGGRDDVPGDNVLYYQLMAEALESMLINDPHSLDNVVIFMACSNKSVNETGDIEKLIDISPDSPLWNHLYFVGSMEGSEGGLGYANNGTSNYIAAPACNVQIPGSECVATGNSGAVPQISSLVAETYVKLKAMNKDFTMADITAQLWAYQWLHNGSLPSASQLASIMSGEVGEVNYEGTWSGTFYYTATVPQDEGPDQIINTSFIVTMTIKNRVALPGYPHFLKITGVTCSDATFGATMVVLPDTTLSSALLPAQYASASETGMTIVIKFPNGSVIATDNSVNGSFTVDETGNVIESSALVANDAFTASGTVDNSNNPGSGPGGYAYNWCTFKSWKFVRL